MINQEGLDIESNVEILPELDKSVLIRTAYSLVRQDTSINALARMSSKSKAEVKQFTTTGIITAKNGSTDLQVIIQDYGNITLKPSTSKLLRIMTMKFTEDEDSKLISFTLKEYMELLGLKDVKEARKTVKEDIEALYNISLEAKRPAKDRKSRAKGKQDYIKFRLIDLQGEAVKNGVIYMHLTDAIANHLRQCDLMPYPKEALKISGKFPYAFWLADKITELMKLNQYNKATMETKDSLITSVRTLLEICTFNGMPTYETVKNAKNDRRVDDRIIKPFERDMEEASRVVKFNWEYCNAKGVPLRDEQINLKTSKGKYRPQSYDEFIEQYIKITFDDNYPIAPLNVKKLEAKKKKTKKEAKTKTA